MKIAIGQIDPVVGAFEANVKKIVEVYQRACQKQARLLLTPELSLCGYPPYDLVGHSEIFDRNEKALAELARHTVGQSCALVVGHIRKNPRPIGKAAQNVATILEGGKEVFSQAKTLLPTYDVFDEARYFEPADSIQLWSCEGRQVALAICEDLWGKDIVNGRSLYVSDPVSVYQAQKADLVLSIASSPYVWSKRAKREQLHSDTAKRLNTPLVYVNQVGATDEMLFDGGSFALDRSGTPSVQLPFFETGFTIVDLDEPRSALDPKATVASEAAEMEILAKGLVLGIREYFARTGFKQAVLGLSGGIDSAVIGALAVEALGPAQVLGVAMPSQFSSSHSLEDAEELARRLKMPFEVRPIKFLYSTASREITDHRGQLKPLALENLQARLRGLVLMTLSNHYSALVLTTGNKSELAMGYCTLYGDMVGALAPIGDLYKTRVYDLARHLNLTRGNPIPERSLTKAPSAELRPNQTDQDTLPPYEVLDQLLTDYVENNLSVGALEKKYEGLSVHPKAGWVRETIRTLELNEYKRKQAAPVLKISSKAFGVGRRLPIAKKWDL